MKYPKNAKLEHVASKEAGRYATHGVKLEKGRMTATNGRILAIVPVEVEGGDNDFSPAESAPHNLIPVEALKAGRKAGCRLSVNGSISVPDGPSFPPIEGSFPNVEAVLQSIENRVPTVTFGIDPKLLYDLARGLGAELVKVTLYDPMSAIKVEPLERCVKGTVGIIMPCKVGK